MPINSVQSFFKLFLAEGIVIFLIGLLIILLPQFTTLVLALLLSFGLIVIGIYRFINAIIMRKSTRHAALTALTSLIVMAIGLYLCFNPFFNVLILTLGIGIYFIIEGINSTIIAIQNRQKLKYWWATFFFSLLQFILAFIIIFGLPYTALWTIGILIGVNLLFNGMSLISIYFSTKHYFKTVFD